MITTSLVVLICPPLEADVHVKLDPLSGGSVEAAHTDLIRPELKTADAFTRQWPHLEEKSGRWRK